MTKTCLPLQNPKAVIDLVGPLTLGSKRFFILCVSRGGARVGKRETDNGRC